MIIVEGPDGSGKTTLINRLMENPGLDLKLAERACTSDNGAIENLAGYVMRDLRSETPRNMLYDRYPLISDPVYGPLIRGYASEQFDDFIWVHTSWNQLMGKRPLFIYCLPPWPEVEVNVTEGHEPNTPHLRGVLAKSRAIYDSYVQMAALSPFLAATWVWDYRKGDFSSLCQNIRSHIGH